MPGKYDSEQRLITLNTELSSEKLLTTTTLIHGVVSDLLFQNKFKLAHFPEMVDLAVVGTGLGLPQSNIGFVKNKGTYWDSTHWEMVPRQFLACQSFAYACALAAWARDDATAGWADELPSDFKKPMRKSLKYLFSTNETFFNPKTSNRTELAQAQTEWMSLAESKSGSSSLVALRHLEHVEAIEQEQQDLIVNQLRNSDRAFVLHAIFTVENLSEVSDQVVDELRFLVENRDDEIRAKALCVLTRLGKIDEATTEQAGKLLSSDTRFVVFSGVFALSTLDSVSDSIIQAANRGFKHALQTCDYEFIGLFASAFDRWLDDPESHFERLLESDGPEYTSLAKQALQTAREQLVGLS